MAETSLEVDGLDALRSGLASARKSLATERAKANREVGKTVAEWSRSGASSGRDATRATAHFAQALAGSGTQRYARISVRSRGRMRGASTAFFGARPLTRTGWNAAVYRGGKKLGGRRRMPGARSQFQPWVGNTWIPGRAGEGPYVINDVLADRADEIDQMILAANDRAVSKAFPEGGSRP